MANNSYCMVIRKYEAIGAFSTRPEYAHAIPRGRVIEELHDGDPFADAETAIEEEGNEGVILITCPPWPATRK